MPLVTKVPSFNICQNFSAFRPVNKSQTCQHACVHVLSPHAHFPLGLLIANVSGSNFVLVMDRSFFCFNGSLQALRNDLKQEWLLLTFSPEEEKRSKDFSLPSGWFLVSVRIGMLSRPQQQLQTLKVLQQQANGSGLLEHCQTSGQSGGKHGEAGRMTAPLISPATASHSASLSSYCGEELSLLWEGR